MADDPEDDEFLKMDEVLRREEKDQQRFEAANRAEHKAAARKAAAAKRKRRAAGAAAGRAAASRREGHQFTVGQDGGDLPAIGYLAYADDFEQLATESYELTPGARMTLDLTDKAWVKLVGEDQKDLREALLKRPNTFWRLLQR